MSETPEPRTDEPNRASAPETDAPREPVATNGDLAKTSPETVLQFCEAQRFTGTLAFEAPTGRGVLPVLAGVPEIPSDPSELSKALDLFASLTEGTYTLAQLLPPLEGTRTEGALGLSGALERVRMGDVLRYCEDVGLTGSVTVRRGAEAYRVRYTRGELSSVTLDGGTEPDLYALFKWREGSFELRARPLFSGEPASLEKHPAALETLEVALTDLLAKSGARDSSAEGAGRADRWESPERPSGAGYPRRRKVSLARDATLPFGIAALREGVVLPPARRTMPPPSVAVTAEATVKIFRLEKGALDPLVEELAAAPSGATPGSSRDPSTESLAHHTGGASSPSEPASSRVTVALAAVLVVCALAIVASFAALVR